MAGTVRAEAPAPWPHNSCCSAIDGLVQLGIVRREAAELLAKLIAAG
ncbi:hypothetical protein [Streptomyces sp. NPDC014995]